jgi:hypothetical protein
MNLNENIDYKAAGIIFTNNTHIIAGYQEDSETNQFAFSGFGGKKEVSDNNNPKFTAIREMLEELFDIQVNLSTGIKEEAISNIESLEQMLADLDDINITFMNLNIHVIRHINYLIHVNQTLITYSDEQVDQNNIRVNKLIDQIIRIPVQNYIYENFYINYIYNFAQLEEILYIIKNNNFTSKYYDQIPTNIFDLITKRKKISSGEIESLALLPVQEDLQVHEYFIQDIKELINPTVNTQYTV